MKAGTQSYAVGTKTRDIPRKRLVVKNGHEGRKLYVADGWPHDVLLICLKGEVIEVVSDSAKQDQRIHQGW